MNFIWINVPQIALAYSENHNSLCLSIQKIFKKQWRTLLKKSDISLIIAHSIPKTTFQSESDATQTDVHLLNDSTVNPDTSFNHVVNVTHVAQSALFSGKSSIATTTPVTNDLFISSLADSTLNTTSSSTASVDTGIHILHL